MDFTIYAIGINFLRVVFWASDLKSHCIEAVHNILKLSLFLYSLYKSRPVFRVIEWNGMVFK